MARKSINKRIIWLIIGTTVSGVAGWLASTKKWKKIITSTRESILDKMAWALDFMSDWLKQMKDDLGKDEKKEESKKKKWRFGR